jgi:hypothetical protein
VNEYTALTAEQNAQLDALQAAGFMFTRKAAGWHVLRLEKGSQRFFAAVVLSLADAIRAAGEEAVL